MSPTLRHRLSFVLSLLIVAGIVYGVVVAGRATLRVLTTLESSVAVSIIAAAGTLLVSVLSIVLGKVYEARSVAKKDIRDRKIPVYEDLINFMFRMLMGEKTGTVPNEDEMLKFMSSFTQRIMVWGTDEVVAAWVKFRRFSVEATATKSKPIEMLFLYEDLIRAIRLDLGHRNRGLARGDILALFVNDIVAYVPKSGR